HHAHEVGCFFEEKAHGCDVVANGTARSGDEDGLGKIGADTGSSVLELEPVAEDKLKTTAGVVTKGFFKLGRGLGVNLTDLSVHRLAYFYKPFIGEGVPAGVADRSWSEQSNTECIDSRWCWIVTTATEAHEREKEYET